MVAAFATLDCAGRSVREEARFSYQNVYADRYQRGDGGVIPITIERGESYGGSISRDQKYLYYSSNAAGNYDIYVRDLSDVFPVPIISTVTNQREPTISPDGKYLVYTDDELDPDGDIMLLKVNPAKIIERYRENRKPEEGLFAAKPKNLTNSEKQRIRARDANPTWSPDGKWIAWSSDLDPQKADELGAGAGALQNIWIMPVDNPQDKRRITERGGVMPSFSPDGKRIVYISYEDPNSLGAVYEVEIATGKTRRLTSGRALDFYPSYAPDGESIILTRVARDSNGDGHIDRKDAGQIIRIYPEEGGFALPGRHTPEELDESTVADDDFVPLTPASENLFDSRVSNFIGGSVLLAQVVGEDINVGFIPLSGAEPVKPDIRQQAQHLIAQSKKKEKLPRVLMALEQLPSAFASSPDLVVYDALAALLRARYDAKSARDLQDYFATADPDELAVFRLLNDLATLDPELVDLRGIANLPPLAATESPENYFEEILRQKRIWDHFRDGSDDYRAILSFIRHAQARHHIRQGRYQEACEVIAKIVRTNPQYLALDELLYENGVLNSTTLPAAELLYLVASEPELKLLAEYGLSSKKPPFTVRPHIRRKAEHFLLQFFERQIASGNSTAQAEFLAGFPVKKYPQAHALFYLASARAKLRQEQYEKAKADAEKAQKLSPEGSLFHYHSAVALAQVAEVREGAEAAIAIYASAVTGYRDSELPESARATMQRIGRFYSERAVQARARGDDRTAAAQYQALLELYLSAYANRLTDDATARELLDHALSLDQIALRAAAQDEKLLRDIMRFYDERIDFARRYLVGEFIFGRGFLRAQLGISRHLAAEAEKLTRSAKREVLEHFRLAEVDLNWCFFANPRFADAYMMLGWIYQFIDEKREVILDQSTGKKDREIFESLYQKYFPDYLFEKNIRLYQKTLSLFAAGASRRVKNSFHLNIANNYYLLNNYAQAEEHYAAILDKKGVPDFQFETPEQEMMFYYHYGRTLYFSGKYDKAAYYLRFVENNLNARYPIAGVNAETQRTNQKRREIVYKILALNSEYAQELAQAIAWIQRILAERHETADDSPASMLHLELARLYLRQGNYSAALEETQKAEELLKKEPEIPIPKFKIRIKWFWVYEPWTWLLGLIYRIPYDDLYIGENQLAFELPTVNRYQLLYSIRADIYRRKGLLHEASAALAKLVEYAKKDKTRHGRETLRTAISRQAELEFAMRSWDNARRLYETAMEQAEKEKNASVAMLMRRNAELCKLRQLESEEQPVREKIRLARRYSQELAEFAENTVTARIKAAREEIREKKDPAKPDLTEEDARKIRERTMRELQPLLFFRALYEAHLAELQDFAESLNPSPSEDFAVYFNRKQQAFQRFRSALRYFRGFTRETLTEVEPVYEPDLKNNSLRLKLAMNRARILQQMGLAEEAIAELQAVQERSQEFAAQLEYTLASYRIYRVYENAGMEQKLALTPYEKLFRYFIDHPVFLRNNSELFEKLCQVLIQRAVQTRNYPEAMRIEDSKRQALAAQLYFQELRLGGPKAEILSRLQVVEEQREVLAQRIRAARLQRQNAQTLEKELQNLDTEATKLRNQLVQSDGSGYAYEALFKTGFGEKDFSTLAREGILYALRVQGITAFIYAKIGAGRNQRTAYELYLAEAEKPLAEQLAAFLKQHPAATIILHEQLWDNSVRAAIAGQSRVSTSLVAAIGFARNQAPARRNLLQLVKPAGFLGLGGGNEVDYPTMPQVERVRSAAELTQLGIHRNIIDYEADLIKKSVVTDNSPVTPGALFSMRLHPNYAIVSRQVRGNWQKNDEFYFATAVDLCFSAMGVGQVLHTLDTRRAAQAKIAQYLDPQYSGQGTSPALLTGNLSLQTDATNKAKSIREFYRDSINRMRKQRHYDEAIFYAEDAISLLPQDSGLRLTAAELNHINGAV
ncbi:MAG: hypothetical protein NZL89_01105, partial [Leptospiraceae bacterium]|nr:hypothetical protein [Leptospiraceae bacterium]